MNHVWHLTRYDLSALWKQAAFLALVQVSIAIYFLYPKGTDPFSGPDRSIALVLIIIWGATVVSLLAAIAFQYPVFKTTSHWLTRPVTPRTILLSRFLSACLLIILPAVLMHGVTHLVVGMGSDVALDNAVMLALAMLAYSGPVLLFAILAGNLVRLWVTLVVIAIGFFVIGAKISPLLAPVSPLLSTTRSGLTLALLIIGSLVGLGISYTKLSRLRSLTIAIATVLGMCGIGAAWPLPLSLFAESDLPQINAPAASTVTVSHDLHAVVDSFPRNPTSVLHAGILTLTPPAPGPTWRATRLEGVVTYASPHEAPDYASAKIDNRDTLSQLVTAALGADFTYLNAETAAPSSRFVLRQIGTASSSPERFVGFVRIETGSPRLIAELPITPELKRRFDSASLVIVSSDLTSDRCNLTVLHNAPRRSFTDPTAAERGLESGTYLLINRPLKQAISLTISKKTQQPFIPRHRRTQLSLSAYIPKSADVTPAQWLADATLGVIASHPENFFRLPVDFPLTPAAPPDRVP